MDFCQCVDVRVAQLAHPLAGGVLNAFPLPRPQMDALVQQQQQLQPDFIRGGHVMPQDAERDRTGNRVANKDRRGNVGRGQGGEEFGYMERIVTSPRPRRPINNEHEHREERKGKEKLNEADKDKDCDDDEEEEDEGDESGSSLRGDSDDGDEQLRDESVPPVSSASSPSSFLRSSLSSPKRRLLRPKKRVSFSLPPSSPSPASSSRLLSGLASSPFLVQRRHGGAIGHRGRRGPANQDVSLSVGWLDRLIVVLMIFLFAFALKKSALLAHL